MTKPLPVGAALLILVALAFAPDARAAAPAQYEYDPAGRRTALKLPNGVKTTYAHDAAGRLTRIESKNAAGNVISAFGYALDATGNRTAMDVTLNGTVNHIAYEFDNAYRLTRETRKDATGQTLYDEGLTYDPVGNRLTRNRTQHINGQMVTENTNYAYNAANQLLTETTNGVTTAYGYDKNGNNTTISTPAANGAPAKNIAMAYDWLNRQTKWTDGTRTESTAFAGADWKRASTTVGGAGIAAQTVKYLYDGDNVLADYDANNALTAFYVTSGLDQNLSIADASGQTAYYTHDALGSVRLLTSANGAILNRYDYTAFGETFAANTATSIANRYTYTAREQSPLAAHGAPMYYRWRNYAPQVGRFGWRDPIGYEGGVNIYEYGVNTPSCMIDSMGLIAILLDWVGGDSNRSELFTNINDVTKKFKNNLNRTIERYVRSLKNISEQEWKGLLENKRIEFKDKVWTGTKEDLINLLEREKGSTWIVQNRGGVEDAIEKIAMLRKALTEDYDELGFGSHGNPGIVEITHTFEDGRPDEIETSRTPLMVLPGQVAVQNSDDLKMIPQAGNLNKLIEAGKKGGFKGFVVGMCYRYADEIVKLGIVPPKVVFSHPDGNKNSICGIKVYPSKIQKTVDDVEVTDDNKRYEQ